MALPEKRRCGVPVGRIRISEFCCFRLPYFVPGCHTFGLKIATAALRPRNDTKMKRFMWGKHTFLFYEVIIARCCSASFFKRFVPRNVPFFSKTCQICHCRVGRKKLRPPRNDTKMVGFHRKPTIFITEIFERFSIYALHLSYCSTSQAVLQPD